MQGGIHIQRLRDELVQVCEGPETVGSHLEIMGFLGHLALQLVIGGAELISHLIESLGEVADLVGGFDGDLVCQVAAADLLNPLAQSDDGGSEAPAEDMRQTEGHQIAQGREANGKPELMPNGGIEDGLRLLNHHPPACPGQGEPRRHHAYLVFIGVLPLDEGHTRCIRVMHQLLDQGTVGEGELFEDQIRVVCGDQPT